MCVVSMIGDHYKDRWTEPDYQYYPIIQNPSSATKEEVQALRKEVLEMKKLLKNALEYDKKNGEPNCQMEDKIEFIKKVAELVGVDLRDVLEDNDRNN